MAYLISILGQHYWMGSGSELEMVDAAAKSLAAILRRLEARDADP